MESIFHICVFHVWFLLQMYQLRRNYIHGKSPLFTPLGAPNVKQNNFNQNSYHMILDLSERIKHVRIIWHDGHRCCGFIIYNIL